ncbi:MAG TPA: IS110 family transposase [Steroidobacteraceae bacterium]|nr:IS110 family transposase [Steroidobacteraceae bacterium]
MNATTVAVDLAKNLFQLAYADASWKLIGTARLTRSQFRRCFQNSPVSLVIMEACGSAHFWAREIRALGIEVRLLPARYVRAYVKRNKTDAADAAALLEAARCADIQPVRIKSVEQQALQSLHRARSLWMTTRTSRINALRGFCREFGIDIAQGARLGLEQIARALADPNSLVPALLRPAMRSIIEEVRVLEVRVSDLEKQLGELARQSAACTTLLSVPGVGLLTATAMVAATSGEVSHFKDARHFAAWFGLTPKEHSSGQTRRIGRISKRGDRYLRMLLTHGARAVLNAANLATKMQRPIDPLRLWALQIQQRSHHNKAVCALANKLARICYAVLRDHEPYGVARLNHKLQQATFAMPA